MQIFLAIKNVTYTITGPYPSQINLFLNSLITRNANNLVSVLQKNYVTWYKHSLSMMTKIRKVVYLHSPEDFSSIFLFYHRNIDYKTRHHPCTSYR